MNRVLVSILAISWLLLCGCEAETRPTQPSGGAEATEDFSQLGLLRRMDWTFGLGEDFASPEPQTADFIPPSPAAEKPEKALAAANPESENAPRPQPPRRIIRNAKLTLEVDSPAQGQQKITSLVEARSGYVVSSELSQFSDEAASQSLTITARVPAAQFDAMLTQLRRIGSRVVFENVTGQDVTEEFLDVEARLRTQQALEAQLLHLLKQTATVSNALEVQRELTRVRTEIETLAGRRQFLENQSALSTITILLHPPEAFVAASATGLGDKFKRAIGDGVRIAVAITLLLLRLLFALLPLALFVGLPLRFWRSRFARRQTEPPTAAAAP